MKWTIKKFSELTLDEFHDLLQLRINIFVVEQECPYPELDDKDRIAYHFFGCSDTGEIIAYTRIFGPGVNYDEASIGRVVVHENFRGKKLGYELMTRSIEQVEKLFHTRNIRIGAQSHLQKFYGSLGFVSTGEDYLEDGIPHTYMVLKET